MTEPLKRALTTPAVLFIGLNCVVGGGIFALPGAVSAKAGPFAVGAIILAGLVVTIVALAYAEAGSMFGRTGGPSVYAEEGLGATAGFTVGWMVWLSYVVGWAALANGFAGYLSDFWPAAGQYPLPVAIATIVALCLVNAAGVRNGAGVVSLLTVAKLVPLLLLVVLGLLLPATRSSSAVATASGGLWSAVLFLIFAYAGFETAAIPAGEMRNPRRSVVIALTGTLVSVTLLYTLVQVAAMRLEPGIAASAKPLADAGARMFSGGGTVMTIGALLSIAGTLSGIALATPRALYALARDGSLPAILHRTNPRGAPEVAIWVTGAAAAALAGTGNFSDLALLMVAGILYQYLVVCLGVAALRLRRPDAARPFKLPLGPAIPAAGAALCAFLLTQQDLKAVWLTLAALAIGLALRAATRVMTARSAGTVRA
jgi:APA family basic amino acid/polyamine antiporter